MTVRAYRLSRTSRNATAFTGGGAYKYGGRWNSPGTRVVYASATLSLAMLEVLAHLDDYSVLVRSYSFFAIDIPQDVITSWGESDLPSGWDSAAVTGASQLAGDSWAGENLSAVLSVPSVVVKHERNYVLNPLHRDFSKLTIHEPESLNIDSRLFK